MQLNPYLNFDDGNAEEAFLFYQSVLGGTEAERLFCELSKGGKIEMPLEDMFGAITLVLLKLGLVFTE
ncbi:MAG TPA: hypothetical protein VK102_05720 [Sphingobacterium sp.]|nr:hypothetical protein [Sphingobacterium sp.]